MKPPISEKTERLIWAIEAMKMETDAGRDAQAVVLETLRRKLAEQMGAEDLVRRYPPPEPC